MGLEEILGSPIVYRVGWTLVHSLWQGAAVAALLAGAMLLLRRRSANVRYAVSCAALVLMLALPAATMWLLTPPGGDAARSGVPGPPAGGQDAVLPPVPPSDVAIVHVDAPPVEMPATHAPALPSDRSPKPSASRASHDETGAVAARGGSTPPWYERGGELIAPALPWIVCGWLVGVLVVSAWHLRGWMQVRRLRRADGRPVGEGVHQVLAGLSRRLGVTRAVHAVESALLRVPTVVGWVRPVILLPAGALMGLTAEQLEAILAHELAHIRRLDYLVNLLQTVAETLLFYHPGVWWVSRCIRAERENCCDDLAVQACGRPLVYARALAAVARLSQPAPRLAVAADGGSLLTRVRRVVGLPGGGSEGRRGWVAGVVGLLAVLAIGVGLGVSAAADKSAGDSGGDASAAKPLQRLWEQIAAEDYETAFRAARSLAAEGDKATALLRTIVKPVSADPKVVEKRIADLDHAEYAVRSKAFDELGRIGAAAEAALRKAMKETGSSEIRSRAKMLLDALADPSRDTPGRRRTRLAVHILETIDTEGSRKVLDGLARGAAKAELTLAARAALDRLAEAKKLLAEPAPAKLEFRIIPNLKVTPKAFLSPEEVQDYVKDLAANGPRPGGKSGPRFCWFETHCELPPSSIVGFYRDRRHVLLWNQGGIAPPHRGSPSDPWELAKAETVKDEEGLPAIRFELGKWARGVIDRSSSTNCGDYLAALIGGKVISAQRAAGPRMHWKGAIGGLMPARRAKALIATLRAGMIPTCEFCETIEEGNLERVKEMLADYPALVRLKKGARGAGDTPLHVAMRRRRLEIAELLLARGADINATNDRGTAPLHSAADSGNTEAVKFLLKHHADVNAVDSMGLTPLHRTVCENFHKDAAEALLDGGAGINAKGKVGMTPLSLAIMVSSYARRDEEVRQGKVCMDLLLGRGAKLDIFSASGLGKLREVQAMVAKDPQAAAAAKAFGGITPLHLATSMGREEVVEFLLAHHADPSAASQWLGTPLHLAARNGHVGVVKLLVESKCDLAAGERRGKTALHLAARYGRKDVVTILLAAGSDVSAGDREGATPLHAAASGGRLEVVKLLLSKGADVKAVTTRYKETVLHRLANGPTSTRGGQTEPGQDFVATGKLLITKGAEVDARDDSGRTPLLVSTHLVDYWRGKAPLRAPLVQLFIDAGADVNARDDHGRTPLHHAAEKTDPAVVKMLLGAGADPFVEARRGAFGGELPLDVVGGPGPGRKEVTRLLRTAMAPRVVADEKAVTDTLLRYLDAVGKDQPEKWAKVALASRHFEVRRWQSLAETMRKDYARVPALLQAVIGVKTRCGWATAMIERPPGGKEPYTLFTLLQLPDATWRVLAARSVSREPAHALGAYLQNDRMTYRQVRNAVFDAVGKTEGLKVWGSSGGDLPRAGKLSVTIKNGRLRMEVPDARPDRVWAIEVHEKLIKKWTGGQLILVRRVEAKADGVKLQAENGKAIWRGADKEYVFCARDGKVHVEVKDGGKTETLTAESFTVEWPSGLRLTPQDKPPATGPAGKDDKAFLKGAAKRLGDALGGQWRVRTRERAPGLGPELSAVRSTWYGVAVPYFVLPFPPGEQRAEKFKTFRRACSAALIPLGSNERCIVLAGPSHEPVVSAKIVKALGLAKSKDGEALRAAHARADWLDFRLAVADPDVKEQSLPKGPTARDIAACVKLFHEKGPNAARQRGDPYQWFALAPFCEAPASLVTVADRSGGRYVLLSDKAEHVILSGSARPRPWHLKHVYITEDDHLRPTPALELDEVSGGRMAKLTAANINRPLAILFDDRVLTIPVIRAAVSVRVIISGGAKGFDRELADRIVRSLAECMMPPDTQR